MSRRPARIADYRADRRGASLLGYGLMVGLVGVVALSAISDSGESAKALFGQTADTLEGAANQSAIGPAAAPSALASASPPNHPPIPGSPVLNAYEGIVSAFDESQLVAGSSDPESAGPITLVSVSGPVGGTVSLSGGVVSWEFGSGQTSGSFSFTLEDAGGAQATGTASVTGIGTASDCFSILAANPSASDGSYLIDPDGSGGVAPFSVECDMSTDGGGWTKIVHGTDTVLTDLTRFPVLTNNVTGFIVDSTYGVSWGGFIGSEAQWNSPTAHNLDLGIAYDEVYLEFTGTYNSPAGGLGRLTIYDQSDVIWFSFNDGNGGSGDHFGHSLYMAGSAYVLPSATTNVYNQAVQIPVPGSTAMNIKMNAYYNSYGYTRRYMRELWYR